MNIQDFLMVEHADRKHVKLKLAYIDIADGDIEAGLLLSQICYWHAPSKETGRPKLRVKKEGQLWIAKGREDWYEEIRLNPKRFDKASKILVNNKLIEKKTFIFAGKTKVHIRLLWENFIPAYEKRVKELFYEAIEEEKRALEEEKREKNDSEPYSLMGFPKTVNPDLPNREIGNAHFGKSITEITTENTTEIKRFVNKEEIINISNDFYSEFSKGRWSKKQWTERIEKLADNLVGVNGILKVDNPIGYIRGCLVNMARHRDENLGRETESKFPPTALTYDWLEQ